LTELRAFEAENLFMVVGTLEPRKGHAQLLEAFDQLWAEGSPVTLAILGRRGWNVESLIARIETHPRRNRDLLWFEAISDVCLAEIYRRAAAVVVPSEGEGFGLPLVEAALHHVPLIARDLPVFREVAGDHAFYFDGQSGADLARAIKNWLRLHAAGQVPRSEGIETFTWLECSRELLHKIEELCKA